MPAPTFRGVNPGLIPFVVALPINLSARSFPFSSPDAESF